MCLHNIEQRDKPFSMFSPLQSGYCSPLTRGCFFSQITGTIRHKENAFTIVENTEAFSMAFFKLLDRTRVKVEIKYSWNFFSHSIVISSLIRIFSFESRQSKQITARFNFLNGMLFSKFYFFRCHLLSSYNAKGNFIKIAWSQLLYYFSFPFFRVFISSFDIFLPLSFSFFFCTC